MGSNPSSDIISLKFKDIKEPGKQLPVNGLSSTFNLVLCYN